MSKAYELCVRFRIRLYEKGVLKQKKLPCFVVSIGNIVVGGTGKTPMSIYIAECLKKMGKKVVVISRGYKGRYETDYLIVSDGEQIFSDAENCGDEPFMMAKRKSFPVVVGKDRFKAGMKAVSAFNPDVIVLDDGFQHLKLKRDLDLLLLDYSNPLGNKRLLPAGRLREPPETSAQRADALVFTRSPDSDEMAEGLDRVLSCNPGCQWFKTFHRPFILKQIHCRSDLKTRKHSLNDLAGKTGVLFSGIAKNSSFFHTIRKLGVNILDHLEFTDHYRYKESDILRIRRTAQKSGAGMILTTEKDWAKLDQEIDWPLDVIVVGIRIEFETPEKMESLLQSRLKNNE